MLIRVREILTALKILSDPLLKFIRIIELTIEIVLTAASIMISCPPRKNAVFFGSAASGISSMKSVFSVQSKF